MTLKELIAQKESNLDKYPKKLVAQIANAEKEIYGRILTLLERLKRDAEGKIEISKSNIAIAAEISTELKKVLTTKDYLTALKEFVKGFDEQAVANDQYFAKAFNGFKESSVADAVLQKAKTTALDQLLGSPAEASFIKPVADIIDTAVSSGNSFTDLIKQIKDFTIGTGEENGKLSQYAEQVAYDSFAFSDRAYTNIISEELDAEWYLYSGTELPNSRPFCEERKGKYFHYKEVESWADLNWQGKADGTNEQTIYIVLGGYRCVDSLLPVSIAVVPQDVIERNLSNGNYQPSEKEMALLGI